jgi:hypothetical protein
MATHEWKAIKSTEEAEIRVKNALEALEQERVKRRALRAARNGKRVDTSSDVDDRSDAA